MSRESNIVWVNRLAWAHVALAFAGVVKFGFEANVFAAGAWVIWACLCAAFALTTPRRIVRKGGAA